MKSTILAAVTVLFLGGTALAGDMRPIKHEKPRPHAPAAQVQCDPCGPKDRCCPVEAQPRRTHGPRMITPKGVFIW